MITEQMLKSLITLIKAVKPPGDTNDNLIYIITNYQIIKVSISYESPSE